MITHPDPEAVRNEHLRYYHAQQRSQARRSKVIDHFLEIEMQLYRKWFELNFSNQLNDLEKLAQRAQELERLVEATNQYKFFKKCSGRVAFQKVSAANENHSLDILMQDAKAAFDKNRKGLFEVDGDDPFFNLSGDEDFGEDFNASSRDFSADDNFERHFNSDIHNSKNAETASHIYLKEIYLKLVSHLHPDKHSSFDQNAQSMWHDLQIAYKRHDIKRLEELLREAAGEKAPGLDLKNMPVGEIYKMTIHLRAETRKMSRRTSVFKKDPAWGFDKRINDAKYLRFEKKRIEKDMKMSEYEMNMAIHHFQQTINFLDSKATIDPQR